jgi:hypothetical protein
MIAGFTGTRKGMTPQQHKALRRLVLPPGEISMFVHGGAPGADSQAHAIFAQTGRPILVRPASMEQYRYWRKDVHTSIVYQPRAPLERNSDIVNQVEMLFACPETKLEELRSGTWATVRRAKRKGIRVIFIYPSGQVESSTWREDIQSEHVRRIREHYTPQGRETRGGQGSAAGHEG